MKNKSHGYGKIRPRFRQSINTVMKNVSEYNDVYMD